MQRIGRHKDEYRISNKEYQTAEVLRVFSISNYYDIQYSLFDSAEPLGRELDAEWLVAGGVLRFN